MKVAAGGVAILLLLLGLWWWNADYDGCGATSTLASSESEVGCEKPAETVVAKTTVVRPRKKAVDLVSNPVVRPSSNADDFIDTPHVGAGPSQQEAKWWEGSSYDPQSPNFYVEPLLRDRFSESDVLSRRRGVVYPWFGVSNTDDSLLLLNRSNVNLGINLGVQKGH